MVSRLKLHEELCELLGSRNVYFQPPESVKMQYPCIRYSISGMPKLNANNKVYLKTSNTYTITVIDRDPDNDISNRILTHFSMVRFDRAYIADNLNHYILNYFLWNLYSSFSKT